MISKDHAFGNYIIDCDKCSFSDSLDADEFQGATVLAKDAGWRIVNDRGLWIHICPSCQEVE